MKPCQNSQGSSGRRQRFVSKTWWESGGQDLWDAITEGFDGNSGSGY